jgi:alpha-1,3-glucosyltransferase
MTSSSALTLQSLLVLSSSILLRSLLAHQPHSGQNNHHGSTVAYGGDFEAQRHWMELTLHLPIHAWYTYDVQYWGLDYPPLTAYGSYVLGWISRVVVGEQSVALDESRGYENETHKAFMRASVIGLDICIYIPIVLMMVKRLLRQGITTVTGGGGGGMMRWEMVVLGVLIQPALTIIDHGHFQYNAVCLALALSSFHYMSKLTKSSTTTTIATESTTASTTTYNSKDWDCGIGWNCIIGSVYFCLALNWKQMALYYAPAIFTYLLGRCFHVPETKASTNPNIHSNNAFTKRMIHIFKQIAILGMTVTITFGILWYPFYHYRKDPNESILDVFLIILKRIFPFQRYDLYYY